MDEKITNGAGYESSIKNSGRSGNEQSYSFKSLYDKKSFLSGINRSILLCRIVISLILLFGFYIFYPGNTKLIYTSLGGIEICLGCLILLIILLYLLYILFYNLRLRSYYLMKISSLQMEYNIANYIYEKEIFISEKDKNDQLEANKKRVYIIEDDREKCDDRIKETAINEIKEIKKKQLDRIKKLTDRLTEMEEGVHSFLNFNIIKNENK